MQGLPEVNREAPWMVAAQPIETLDYPTLARWGPALRERINRFRLALGRHFVGRQEVIDLMVSSALAQQPLLLLGPPGTAKSELVVKFKDALGVSDEDYFEYLLTRFSEPSEIFGPIDIKELREGRYLRRDQGKLPSAQIVFLDEVFQSNSAILNSLLSVINEGKFYQDGRPQQVRMKLLFGAANQLPDHPELAALKDRFPLKVRCASVQESAFDSLLDLGLAGEAHRQLNRRPWAEGHAGLLDFLTAHRYLSLQMAQVEQSGPDAVVRDRDRYFEPALLALWRRVLRTLAAEDGIRLSDRGVIKFYRLLRTHAWVVRGGVVAREDLAMLAHVGDSEAALEVLAQKVPLLLGLEERSA